MTHPVYLKNGEQVKINDHVYCSPSWAVRDGTPYSIARIMQFLPPEDAPKGKDAQNYLYTRVRLAWYYRPSDVSDRPVADSRLLLAAIYSEVCDINQLRAKCHVIHRDKISDLAGWKKRPDRFYFNRLFDPYIKKEFEIIPSTDVRNLPDDIRETLVSRYEYVVAEKEVIPDLTDSLRLCDTCHSWCPNADTVQCHRCKRFFHMGCVQPPLSAKPTRGYGWTCAPCARQHEEEVDSHEVRHPTPLLPKPKSNAPAPRGRGRPRKDRTLAEKEENLPVKHFNMWPFRYFGQHTVAEDTLDSEDLIFPRTATRVGQKFQANIPPAPDFGSAGYGENEERGGDNTVEVLGILNTLTESELAEVVSHKKGLTNDKEQATSVDWLSEVVRRYSDAAWGSKPLTSVSMKLPMRLEKWKKHETSYLEHKWTRDEVAAFEDGILVHGAELRAIFEEMGTRTMPEVVRFYGHWKNEKLSEENRRIKQKGPPPKRPMKQYGSAEEAGGGQHVGYSDDEGSVVLQSTKTPVCAACRTRESKIWWKAPKGLQTNVLCDTCGTNWRKYADLSVRPWREESLPKTKAIEKREGTPLAGPSAKRAKTSTSAQSTPPPVPPANAPQIRCVACHKYGSLGKVLQCKQCGLRVHAGSYGASPDAANLDSWICDLCRNLETEENCVNSNCLLCPKDAKQERASPDSASPSVQQPQDNYLRARKPTEGQGWAHVLCAVFTPDLVFTDAARLRLVEKISLIPRRQWLTACAICNEVDGSVIKCSDCPKEFHVSCAWGQGYRFGFEIQQVKGSRQNMTTMVTFNDRTGCMNHIVSCKEHDRSRRELLEICETNEEGKTALQVYCQSYKQVPVKDVHGLLRKARRLDQILGIKSEGPNGAAHTPPPTTAPMSSSSSFAATEQISDRLNNTSISASNSDTNTNTGISSNNTSNEPHCGICKTKYSPMFYRMPASLRASPASTVTAAASTATVTLASASAAVGAGSVSAAGSGNAPPNQYCCHRCHYQMKEEGVIAPAITGHGSVGAGDVMVL